MLDLASSLQNSITGLTPAELFFALLFGTFISEDAACLLAGTSVAAGQSSLLLAVGACLTGIFLGDISLYVVGRALGAHVFEIPIAQKMISESSKIKVSKWIESNAAEAVFLSRFVSGLRLPTYLAAGALRTNAAKFTLLFLVASAVWTPLLVGSAAFSQSFIFGKNALLGFIVLVILVRLSFRYSRWNNRRFLIGKIRRIINWEFWPLGVFYIPVILYVFLLSLKHRSLTLFTAANPAIPFGGFVGESKDVIYRMIESSGMASEYLLRHALLSASLDPSKRYRKAFDFIQRERLTFPIVLKPDAGERGKGVRMIGDFDTLAANLKTIETDHLLQEYYDGVEASVFYYRFPSENRGKIFSITEKVFPVVTGDGESNLESLILRDERAVCMAKHYLTANRERLENILPKNEVTRLIDVGTHSRGAVFREGNWLLTDELETRIDDICRRIDGFFFGRFDLRAKTFDELKLGRFKVIELNGVTSESTNIYDKRYSLFDAYRILFSQWKIAFDIGAASRTKGVEPAPAWQLIKFVVSEKLGRRGPSFRESVLDR
jgi:membrane protein DedA with SNARE-associated domain